MAGRADRTAEEDYERVERRSSCDDRTAEEEDERVSVEEVQEAHGSSSEYTEEAGSGEGSEAVPRNVGAELLRQAADDNGAVPEAEDVEGEDDDYDEDDDGEFDITSTGQEIVTDSFGEVVLTPDQVEQMQAAWSELIRKCGGRDDAATLVYTAFSTASPSVEQLFVTPQAVFAYRLFGSISSMVMLAGDAKRLKIEVETLAYSHMYLDITVPRVQIIRDAFVDSLIAELASRLTSTGTVGFVSLCNYIGGAMIFIKANYYERFTILSESWKLANDETKNAERMASASSVEMAAAAQQTSQEMEDGEHGILEHEQRKHASQTNQNIPTTFNEMFMFNAAVMGYGQNLWMTEVLALLDNIVTNFATIGRVHEECSVLTVRIAKVVAGKVNLMEFKSCMLASLRSLLPKEWTPDHEVAWAWCWERVESYLLKNMGKTSAWEQALEAHLDGLDNQTGYQLRQEIYSRFFASSPEGESFFKQNMTYLHLLITKNLSLCVNMYRDPVQNVDDISAIGLRHVGYGVPTELFHQYVTTLVYVMKDFCTDEVALKAFSWSMNLVTQMMARTVTEGSTIVMKAININSPTAIKAAIDCAARGVRAEWMLLITVGTKDISPFLWAVTSGAVDAARAMLQDLLTIRADRDKYYYGADYLFQRHPDLVQTFLRDAPMLMLPMFDGLIWRSRLTVNGYRRTNYYLKHMIFDADGKLHKTLHWLVKANNPKFIVHPLMVLVSDVIWSRVALRSFVKSKIWLVFTLVIFVFSQSILKGLSADSSTDSLRLACFLFRVFIYVAVMGQMQFTHTGKICKAYTDGDTVPAAAGWLKVPAYLANWQESCNLLLTLLLLGMLFTEPILHCVSNDGGLMFTDQCEGIDDIRDSYYVLNMFAMIVYYSMLVDLAVFQNRVSAYVLVCGRMLSEVLLFLIAMIFLLLTLGSAFSCLEQDEKDFQTIQGSAMVLWEILLGMFDKESFGGIHGEPVVLLGVYVYMIIALIFMLNLLTAQLTCSYDAIYADMVGYARLKRSRIIIETMPSVSARRWEKFKNSLRLDTPIEFNEGDVGIAGGIQVLEPATAHPTMTETIKRYGGTTSPEVQWPLLEDSSELSEDKYGKLEQLIKKAMEALAKTKALAAGRSGVRHTERGSSGDTSSSVMSGDSECS
eukprot:TRINITY_DN18251_c0_g1_i2.p1 TRINITY_DN18251_c0_g1~~TRINITY_DN18251_c0_g1_i2.p1  ORF type:complete len:1149 (-),score=288.60 TRINITY_DN18251_c0_g1_i2:196-3642(-)